MDRQWWSMMFNEGFMMIYVFSHSVGLHITMGGFKQGEMGKRAKHIRWMAINWAVTTSDQKPGRLVEKRVLYLFKLHYPMAIAHFHGLSFIQYGNRYRHLSSVQPPCWWIIWRYTLMLYNILETITIKRHSGRDPYEKGSVATSS